MVEPGDEVRRRGPRLGPILLLIGLTAAALVGCGDDSDDEADTTSTSETSTTEPSTTETSNSAAGAASVAGADLDGRTFLSTRVTGQELVADSVIRLSFEGSRLAVNAGCNTMTGDFAVDDAGTLAWSGEPAATMMGCEEDLMAQDTWLGGAFTDGMAATLDDGTLTLTGDEITLELAEEADTSVLGTTWTLDGLIEADSVSSLPQGVEPATIEIADDGTANVFAGCNNGGTKVTVTDSTITFEPMRLTRMACEGEASTVEAAVVAVFEGEVDMVVSGKTLTLTKGDRGLMFRAL